MQRLQVIHNFTAMIDCVTIKIDLKGELQCYNVGSVPMLQKNEQLILKTNLWAESRELLLCAEYEVAWFSSWWQRLGFFY